MTMSPELLGLVLTRRLTMSRSAPVEMTLHDADPALLPVKNSKESVVPVAILMPVVPTVTHGAICPVMMRLVLEPAERSGIKNTRLPTAGLVGAMDDVRYWIWLVRISVSWIPVAVLLPLLDILIENTIPVSISVGFFVMVLDTWISAVWSS